MWTFAWPWLLIFLPMPWLVRRVLPPASVERGAALVAPPGSPLADLASSRAGRTARVPRLALLWLVWT
ncbi:MAG: BatB protein, partial [Gammaproteobacteria bacterium]